MKIEIQEKYKKIAKIVGINGGIFALNWLALEIFFGVLLSFNEQEQPILQRGLIGDKLEMNDSLGYRAKPNQVITALKTYKGDTLYDVTYSIDSLSCRKNIRNNHTRKNTALFFGCSCTFGEGVQDTMNIPYFFSILDSSYNTYNFALGGYGTHQMTALLEKGMMPKSISKNDVFAVYFYLDGHVQRNVGSMNVVNSWGAPAPYYSESDGIADYEGLFSEDRYIVNFFYRILGKSRVLRYFNVDLPFVGSENSLELTAALIEKSFQEYKKRSGNSNFFVVNFPGSSPEIFEYIANPEIKKLDYASLIDLKKYSIPVDGHPNEYAYKSIALQLAEDLIDVRFALPKK